MAKLNERLRQPIDAPANAHGVFEILRWQLFEPLPPTCDVASPSFRYEDFSSTARDPGHFGSKVEAERKKLNPTGLLNPDSTIARKLNG